MKKLILIALVLTGLTAKAQYFQHVYGLNNDEYGLTGVNTTGPMPIGQFMTGLTLSCLPVRSIPATYTDINGNVPGGPFFNENYVLTDPGSGALLNTLGFPQPMELQTCPGRLGIVGGFSNHPAIPENGVFFMHLAPGGGVGAIFTFTPVAGSGFIITDVQGIERSNNFPGDWFVTGSCLDPAGFSKVFAVRFNECTGAMVWGQIYDILPPAVHAYGRDIAENLIPVFGPPGAAIVGKINTVNGDDDAFLIHIDANTGMPAPHPAIITGFPNSNEEWRSIKTAQAGIWPPGFILGGYTNINGNYDFLITRMDPLIGPLFLNIFDVSFAPGNDNYCYDVMERLNSACQYEYYAVGNARNSIFGNADVMVVKMDPWGNGVPGGEFIYGGGGDDFGNNLDQRNMVPCGPPPPNFDGLSIFGSTNNSFAVFGGADMYMIRAYYNGVSGCNEAFFNPLQLGGLPPMPQMPVNPIINLNPNMNLTAFHFNMKDQPLCFAPVIAGGNNARVAPKEDKTADDALLIMPNPTAAGSKEVTLQIESEVTGDATIEIYDLLGKLYYSNKHTLSKGINKLPVDISSTNMAAGMYSVKVLGQQQNKTVTLIVK